MKSVHNLAEAQSVSGRVGRGWLRMSVAAEPIASRFVREAVAEFGRDHGFEETDLTFILTALGEALANAIEHSGTSEPIEVCCVARKDRILVSVRDHGRGLADGAGAAGIPPMHRERGRGFPIMRTCSDIFSLRSVAGGGTLVLVGRYVRAEGRRRRIPAARQKPLGGLRPRL
jgi:anti-sigma regulatory factor (Ser/Thr protein kinase)